MEGYVWAHRSLLTHKYFQNEKLFKIMMYCLFKASHTKHETIVGIKEINLEKGQFVFGRKRAAIELNMTESTVWKYFKVLEKDKFIIINSNNKFSVVSVVNWASYQYDEAKSNNKKTTKKQQSNTNNNVYKGNKKDYTDEFEKLYAIYPRSENKSQTFNNYKKLLKKYTHDQLFTSATRYQIKTKGKDKNYLTNSSNFFGTKAVYLDYLEAEKPKIIVNNIPRPKTMMEQIQEEANVSN